MGIKEIVGRGKVLGKGKWSLWVRFLGVWIGNGKGLSVNFAFFFGFLGL